ncbi:MAG: iron-containing alcohol dehydrogenase, partial [Duncaniella sp.]|nr:iron-containing alcohol dehydrogenase [Duncaniella sp.]
PAKVAQLARRVFGIDTVDDHEAALQGIARLRSFFHAIGMPVTMAELGIPELDIDLLVAKLHENKGSTIGAYIPLTADETKAIYQLAIND